MKIAICDDDLTDLGRIKNYCTKYDSEIPVASFTSGEALLAAYKDDFFDLVFLDIEMGQIDGLEVGTRLVSLPHKPVIIFTTQSLNYAVRGYGIALRYLPKPISFDIFSQTMSLALDMILPKKISIFSGGAQMLVPVNEIVYFEVLHHQVIVHMKKGEQLSTRSSLSEIINALPGGSFVQPHKSYYINIDYVDRITQQTIKMLNGDMIPISRSRKDVFQARLSEYVKGHRPDEHLD